MVLVDTSIWVTHLRQGSAHLEQLLLDGRVACHPFVVGELACGNIKNSQEFLILLQSLPIAPSVTLDELLHFIEQKRVMGTGIGLVDAHLLASAQLSEIPLWTSDKVLRSVATQLNLAYR